MGMVATGPPKKNPGRMGWGLSVDGGSALATMTASIAAMFVNVRVIVLDILPALRSGFQ